jgi:hypothetical protein
MRVFGAVMGMLSMGLVASPLLAKDAKDAGKEESPAKTAADKPKETTKPENAVIESELEGPRSLVQSQMQELESQQTALKTQQLKMEALEEELHSTSTGNSLRNQPNVILFPDEAHYAAD